MNRIAVRSLFVAILLTVVISGTSTQAQASNSTKSSYMLIGVLAGAAVGALSDADGGEVLALGVVGGLIGYLVADTQTGRLMSGNIGNRKNVTYQILPLEPRPMHLSPVEQDRARFSADPGRVDLISIKIAF